MVYPHIDLRTAGMVVGIFLILVHLLGLIHSEGAKQWLHWFPRSRAMAVVLLGAASIWSFILVATIDLGEFTPYRRALMIIVPVAFFLSLRFMDEFLSVRALGILMLLAAEPVLESAFLQEPQGRLLLVALAYVWVVLGLFWVGMPYLLRDQIQWLLRGRLRYHGLAVAGLLYGVVLLSWSLTLRH